MMDLSVKYQKKFKKKRINKKANPDFSKLTFKISFLQQALYYHFGIEKIYIGGGSSRAILDHLYFDKPLKMRDIDVFVNLGQACDFRTAKTIGERLCSKTLGQYSHSDLRARPRANPLSTKAYNAGYGFFLIDEACQIIDLSLFNSAMDLRINGIFDIDKILLPLSYDQNLEAFHMEFLKKYSFDVLVRKQVVEDPYLGYHNWLKRQARIINWLALKLDPIVVAVRVVRTYAALDYTHLPNSVSAYLKNILSDAQVYSELQLKRNIAKLQNDQRAKWSMVILKELGLHKFL